MTWANPEAFWLIIPAAAIVFFSISIWKQRTWRYKWFTNDEIKAFPNVKLGLRLSGLVLLLIAAFGPVWENTQNIQNQHKIWFLLDISESMFEQEDGMSRVEKAKNQMLQIADKLSNSQLGLMVFSSAPNIQVPLTSDIQIFKELTSLIYEKQIQGKGTNIRKALNLVADRVELADMQDTKVVIFTDGDDYGENFQSAIERLQNTQNQIIWVGCGLKSGQIPINEVNIKKWAKFSNAAYLVQSNHDFIPALISHLNKISLQRKKANLQEQNQYQIPLFFAFFALFMTSFLFPRRN